MKSTKRTGVIMLVVVGTVLLVTTMSSYSQEIVIKSGTPVPLRLDQTVTSEEATAGQTVKFVVTRDVEVNDVVVIKAGSVVEGEITHAEKTGSLGKEGKVSLVVRYATAIDNTRVPLRAQLSQTGEERVALSWLVCPFIKGTPTQLPAGTETKAYVDYDTKIDIKP